MILYQIQIFFFNLNFDLVVFTFKIHRLGYQYLGQYLFLQLQNDLYETTQMINKNTNQFINILQSQSDI